jgi:hypothetical protein
MSRFVGLDVHADAIAVAVATCAVRRDAPAPVRRIRKPIKVMANVGR